MSTSDRPVSGKMWGGRFSEATAASVEAFSASVHYDARLYRHDIMGSRAHARMLARQGLITGEECAAILQGLDAIEAEIDRGDFVFRPELEDVHMNIEKALTERIGPAGAKLHTARSRNDQVNLDFRLYLRDECDALDRLLQAAQRAFVRRARHYLGVVMPGYTHLQRAQPVTFAHWALAYVEMLERDHSRLQDALKRLDTSPLGCGALAGTAYAIDREALALDMGFSGATRNSLDSVSDRDHVVELMNCASLSMVHLSRFAEDLIFFNTGEAGFVELSDKVTSGSSLMPQKKNPDALELIRGKAGRVVGAQMGMMMTLKALPLAYNKDMQEDKEGLFDALDSWHDCLDMACLVLDDIKVNQARTLAAAQGGYANATELADYLVAKGIPFREAHHIVGESVVYAIQVAKPLEDLSLDELRRFSSVIGEDVYPILSLESTLGKRVAKGGVAPGQIDSALAFMESHLAKRLG